MKNNDIGILVVDDERTVRDALCGWFEKDGYRADSAADGIEALTKLSERSWDVILVDLKMPGMSGMELHERIKEVDPASIVIIITAYATVETAVEALKNGAFDYVTKPIDPGELSLMVGKALEHRRLKTENIRLKERLQDLSPKHELIGQSLQMKEIQRLIEQVSQTDVTVLIRGESGTGKEMVARLIHDRSPRRHLPMVAVNCGALSESLLESELFGHEKGAFTGALYRHRGKLEMAHGGTLFLDEVGAISLKTQVELLRVLETKQFTRLGGDKTISVDFRVICATNQDLEELSREGGFREDLYYRLNVFGIRVPPLRERAADIPLLARHFLKKYAGQIKRNVDDISPEAIDAMMNSEWRGNVRELENAIERAVVVCRGEVLLPEDLPIQVGSRRPAPESNSLQAVEKSHIEKVLGLTDWNITKSAKILNIDRVTLYNKIKKYDLSKPAS